MNKHGQLYDSPNANTVLNEAMPRGYALNKISQKFFEGIKFHKNFARTRYDHRIATHAAGVNLLLVVSTGS